MITNYEQKIKSYINLEVYQQHHLLAAALAVAGALHQLVVCECTEHLQFTVDELVYIYSRVSAACYVCYYLAFVVYCNGCPGILAEN